MVRRQTDIHQLKSIETDRNKELQGSLEFHKTCQLPLELASIIDFKRARKVTL